MYIAIDQGGHATRALLFNVEGIVVAQAEHAVDTHFPADGWVEHDPEAMLQSLHAVLKAVISSTEIAPGTVCKIGLATQRSSIACWDRETGEPLSPIISWQDRRAASWLSPFEGDQSLIHRTTGLFLTPYYGVSKLQWCYDHLPAVAEAHRKGRLAWGPMASLLLFHLLRDHGLFADPANASRTLLWSLQSQSWSDELLHLFHFTRESLPRCVPSRYDYGEVATERGEMSLALCTGDQSAAIFAFGQPQEETVYINLGTGGFIQMVTKGRPVMHDNLLSSILYSDGRRHWFALEGTVNGAGSALRNQAAELDMETEQMEQGLSQWLNEQQDPPLFINGVSGLGSPYWRTDVASRYLGDGSGEAKLVAVAESIIFLLKVNFDLMQRAHAAAIQKVVVTGGLAKQDGLCQRLADLFQLPVKRPVECEATARGTAFLLAGMPEQWQEPGEPDWFYPVDNAPLQRRFSTWKQEMDRL